MLRWESLQTKTETEFAFTYILKAAKDARIERVFTLENSCGPRLSKDGVTYSTLRGKLYILFENQMCLIIYTTTESEIYELEFRPLTDEEKRQYDSLDESSQDMFNTHIEIYGWLFDEDGSRIESSFKIREIEDIRLQYASIQQVRIHGFKHEFEKWVYKGGYPNDGGSHELITIPAGGDYFDKIEFILSNEVHITVSGEPAMSDGYFDVWCSGPEEALIINYQIIDG